ncbi:uncharacterized protein LOC143374203 [Andrena cerasifolii]|uniref:uncharacterized protein LOC143374203 n=1 Tax=Andrena cerasifolii TaxID=2819439 RepID=UPI004037E596
MMVEGGLWRPVPLLFLLHGTLSVGSVAARATGYVDADLWTEEDNPGDLGLTGYLGTVRLVSDLRHDGDDRGSELLLREMMTANWWMRCVAEQVAVEIEEELRPLYEEAELIDLVSCVREMTTLRRIDDDEWGYHAELTIRDFFLNPSVGVLCVYRIYNHLNVSLRFPIVPVNELTYFIREPREILRADTFRERVLFGTVNDNVETYVLHVVQNVLAPIFVKIDTWPDSILPLLTSRLINQPRG